MRNGPEVQSHLVGHQGVSVVKQVDVPPGQWAVFLWQRTCIDRESKRVNVIMIPYYTLQFYLLRVALKVPADIQALCRWTDSRHTDFQPEQEQNTAVDRCLSLIQVGHETTSASLNLTWHSAQQGTGHTHTHTLLSMPAFH